MIIASSIISITVIAGVVFYINTIKKCPSREKAANVNTYRALSSTATTIPSSDPQSVETTQQPTETDLWQQIQDLIKVERVDSSGDPKQKKRRSVKNDFNTVAQMLKTLRAQGLEGTALYDEAENRLVERHGPSILKILEGYHLLEEELAEADLNAMTPEERLEYIQKARRYAFGEEMADLLFFENEALAGYKLQEKEILDDTSLSPEAQNDMLTARRNALQVDLASRGSYVGFADERKQNLEAKLQDRYGEKLQDMTPEERKAAIWDMYEEELPQEVMDKVKVILDKQEEKKALHEAYRHERDRIMNDPDKDFQEKQEALAALKARYNLNP